MSQATAGSDLRWVVDQSGLTLRAVLQQLSGGDDALRDGRVFLAQRRAIGTDLDATLEAGTEVIVYRSRAALPAQILDEHEGVLAVNKPAGIATQPDHRGIGASLLGELMKSLAQKPGTLHALHRLDLEVSGVVLVSRGSQATLWVERARTQGTFRRRYVALGVGDLQQTQGTWHEPIGNGSRPGLRRVAGPDAKVSITRYEVVAQATRSAKLLIVEPFTGRTHQIRVHSAHAGLPLVGDADYGGLRRVTAADGSVREMSRIALHALKVEIAAPGEKTWSVEAPVPEELYDLWKWFGGQQQDFSGLSQRGWLS